MRFVPVERPQGLYMRVVYWVLRRQYGKVPVAVQVLYARRPRLLGVAIKMVKTMQRLEVEPELALLVHAYTSLLNGCGYCRDLSEAEAVKRGLGLERFSALDHFEDADCFLERERIVLRYAAAIVRDRQVPEHLLEQLRREYSDHVILDLTWLIASGTYFNALAIPLELGPDGLRALAERRQHS